MAVIRSLTIFLIIVCVGDAFCGPVLTPDVKFKYGVVHVRKERSVKSKILDHIWYGQRIRCRDDCQPTGDWLPVITARNETGWMHKDHVHLATPSEIEFTIRFLDVGNGNAAILTIRDKSIIIDGGPNPAFITRYLQRHGNIGRDIPIVIVTSMDEDHFTGLTFLTRCRTGQSRDYWGPTVTDQKDSYGRFVNRLEHNGFRVLSARSPHCERGRFKDRCDDPYVDMPAAVPEADITILHTNTCLDDSRRGLERESLVVRVDVADQRFLFTGDIYGKNEDENAEVTPQGSEGHLVRLARANGSHPGLLNAAVLVVPDHGADTASTFPFINSVRPKFAIFSAEPEYNAPKAAVVDRYRQKHAEVLRTDMTRGPGNDTIVCSHARSKNPNDPSEPLRCTYEGTRTGSIRHRLPFTHP